MKLTAALRFALILIGLAAASQANAVCSSPAGIAGDIAYSSNINAPVYCDGTTWTSMSGGSGSGGGTANPAGTTNDVQFNSAGSLAADTGLFTYVAGLLRAPTISATTLNGQYASLTTIFNAGSFSGNTIAANSVSSTLISATNISTTYLQIQSASTVLTCGSNLAGAMRYTSGTMQVCNGSSWGNIGLGVPTGTIAAFATVSCPLGWTEYTPSRGRFLRGIDNGAGNDPDGTRSPGASQSDLVGSHTHNVYGKIENYQAGGGNNYHLQNPGSGTTSVTVVNAAAPSGGAETRPKNVAVTYCVYSGFQSQLQTGVATLASLSDVSINGATSGQSLIFNGSAWVASTTTPSGSSALGDRITSGTASLIAKFNQGISSSVPLEVSGTVKMSGTGAEACVSGTVGTFRFNPINGVPQICR